jgi:hypothetical protein
VNGDLHHQGSRRALFERGSTRKDR